MRPPQHPLEHVYVARDALDAACAAQAKAEPPDEELPSYGTALFAALNGLAELTRVLARQVDPGAQRRIRKGLDVDVARGERLHFELDIPALEVAEPLQSLVWRGQAEPVQFVVKVPDQPPEGNLIGTVTVLRQGVPVGHLKFIVRAVSRSWGPAAEQPLVDAARRYRKAFISYPISGQ